MSTHGQIRSSAGVFPPQGDGKSGPLVSTGLGFLVTEISGWDREMAEVQAHASEGRPLDLPVLGSAAHAEVGADEGEALSEGTTATPFMDPFDVDHPLSRNLPSRSGQVYAISGDGSTVAVSADTGTRAFGKLLVFDRRPGGFAFRTARTYNDGINSVSLSFDGKRGAVCYGTTTVDVDLSNTSAATEYQPTVFLASGAAAAAVTRDGRFHLSLGTDGTVQAWDVAAGSTQTPVDLGQLNGNGLIERTGPRGVTLLAPLPQRANAGDVANSGSGAYHSLCGQQAAKVVVEGERAILRAYSRNAATGALEAVPGSDLDLGAVPAGTVGAPAIYAATPDCSRVAVVTGDQTLCLRRTSIDRATAGWEITAVVSGLVAALSDDGTGIVVQSRADGVGKGNNAILPADLGIGTARVVEGRVLFQSTPAPWASLPLALDAAGVSGATLGEGSTPDVGNPGGARHDVFMTAGRFEVGAGGRSVVLAVAARRTADVPLRVTAGPDCAVSMYLVGSGPGADLFDASGDRWMGTYHNTLGSAADVVYSQAQENLMAETDLGEGAAPAEFTFRRDRVTLLRFVAVPTDGTASTYIDLSGLAAAVVEASDAVGFKLPAGEWNVTRDALEEALASTRAALRVDDESAAQAALATDPAQVDAFHLANAVALRLEGERVVAQLADGATVKSAHATLKNLALADGSPTDSVLLSLDGVGDAFESSDPALQRLDVLLAGSASVFAGAGPAAMKRVTDAVLDAVLEYDDAALV